MAEILWIERGEALTYTSYRKYGERDDVYEPVEVRFIGNLEKGDVHFIGKIRQNIKGERFIILDNDGVNITDDVLVLAANVVFN